MSAAATVPGDGHRQRSRRRFLGYALGGACLVVAADFVTRVIIPFPLPAGLVTAAIGAPYLIWLLLRRNRKVSA